MNKYTATGTKAFVNGKALPLRQDIINHSPDGVGWGYLGSGPSQFALAIMINEFGEDISSHPATYQEFKHIFVANLHGESIQFDSNDIYLSLGMISLSNRTLRH